MNNSSGIDIEPSLHYHMSLLDRQNHHHPNGGAQDCSPAESLNYNNSLSPSSGDDDSSSQDFLEANIPQKFMYNDVLDFDLNNSIFSLLGLDRIDKIDENEPALPDSYSATQRHVSPFNEEIDVKCNTQPSHIYDEHMMLDALDHNSDALSPDLNGSSSNFSSRDLAFLNDIDLANLPDLLDEFGPDDISHLYSLVHGSGSGPATCPLPQSQVVNGLSSPSTIPPVKGNHFAPTKAVFTSPTSSSHLPPTLSFGSLKKSQALQSPIINGSTQFREKIIKLQQKIGAVFKNELEHEQNGATYHYPPVRDGVIKANNTSPLPDSPTRKKLRFDDADSNLSHSIPTARGQNIAETSSPTQFLILNKPLNTSITTSRTPMALQKQPSGAQFILPHGYRQSVLKQPPTTNSSTNPASQTLGLAGGPPRQNGLKFNYGSRFTNEWSTDISQLPDIISYEEKKQIKKLERMIKNRESASLSRRRKKEYIKSLESRVEQLTREKRDMEILNGKLKKKIDNLETENTLLKKVLPLLKLTKPGLLFCFVILFIIRLSPPISFYKTNENYGKRMDGLRQLTSLEALDSPAYNNRLLKGLPRPYNESSYNPGHLQSLSVTLSPISITTEPLYYYDKAVLLENNLTDPNSTLPQILLDNENLIAKGLIDLKNLSFYNPHVTSNWLYKFYQTLGVWLGLDNGPWSEFEYQRKALALFMSHYDVPSLCASANFVPLNSSNATHFPRLNPKLKQWVGSLMAGRLIEANEVYSNRNPHINYTHNFNGSFAAGLNDPLASNLWEFGNLTKKISMDGIKAKPRANRSSNRNVDRKARKELSKHKLKASKTIRSNGTLNHKNLRDLKSVAFGNKTSSSLNDTMNSFTFHDPFATNKQLSDSNSIWSNPAQSFNDTHPTKNSNIDSLNQPDCHTIGSTTVLVNRTQERSF